MSTKTHKINKAKTIISLLLAFVMLNSLALTAFAAGDVLLIAPAPGASAGEAATESSKAGRPLNEKYTSDYGQVIEGDYLDLESIPDYVDLADQYAAAANATEGVDVKLSAVSTEYRYVTCTECGVKSGAGNMSRNATGNYICPECGGVCSDVQAKTQKLKLSDYEGKDAFYWDSDYTYIEFDVYVKQSGLTRWK